MTRRGGYTLVEVMIAAGIVAAGIAAAAMLGLTMVSQQAASARVVRAMNYQEQAGRLYQMGLEPDTITGILPLEPGVVSLTFTTNSAVLANLGTVHVAVCELVYDAGSLLTSDGSASVQTNEFVVVRPSIR